VPGTPLVRPGIDPIDVFCQTGFVSLLDRPRRRRRTLPDSPSAVDPGEARLLSGRLPSPVSRLPRLRLRSALRGLLLASIAGPLIFGAYAVLWQTRDRVIEVCVVTDFQYRTRKPDWERTIGPLFDKVNHFFAHSGVKFHVTTGGDAYPEDRAGSMVERWQLLSDNDCKADLVVGFTGQVEREATAIAVPFSHVLLIKDTGGNTDAMFSATVARALANTFGAPVSTGMVVATDASNDELFDQTSSRIIREMRQFDFSRGAGALRGKWEKRALAVLSNGLAAQSAHPEAEARRVIARAYAGARLHADAVRHLREAVRVDAGDANLHFELAMSLRANAEPEAALAELKEAARLEPDNAMAHAAMGTLHLNASRHDEAVEEWRTAARLDPRNATFQTALGEALLKRPGLMKDAAAAFETAVLLRPSEYAAQKGLARQSAIDGRLQQTLRAAENKVHANPASPTAHAELAQIYGVAGDFAASRKEALRTLELDPRSGQAHAVLAELDYLAGQYSAADREGQAAKAAGAPVRQGLLEAIDRQLGRQHQP
jgi:tetratricopeptide (TPR) repeat protein